METYAMYYILRYSQDSNFPEQFVALDKTSGGYPYPVEYPRYARIWNDKSEALKYAEMFKDKIQQKVYELHMTVKEPISDDEDRRLTNS